MAGWTIHLPPDGEDDSQAERFVAVKDGLRPMAVLFGPLWLLTKRLWLGALGVAAVEMALAALVWGLALPRPTLGALQGLLHLLLGLEASSIQRWTLRRRGWREVGAIIAHRKGEAETRAAELVAGLPEATPVAAAAPRPYPAAVATPPVLGLFPEARPR